MKQIDTAPGSSSDAIEVALASAPSDVSAKLRALWSQSEISRTPSGDAQGVNKYVKDTCGIDIDVNRFRHDSNCAVVVIRSGDPHDRVALIWDAARRCSETLVRRTHNRLLQPLGLDRLMTYGPMSWSRSGNESS